MPVYEWECEGCQKVTEVINKFAECYIPPDEECECGAEKWRKMISNSIAVDFAQGSLKGKM